MGGKWGMAAKGSEVYFGDDAYILKLDSSDSCRNHTKKSLIIYLKKVHFTVDELYANKAVLFLSLSK